MNLRATILKEHSKAQCNKIVSWVGKSQERFDELFELFLHDEYRVVQRAAWPVSYCVMAYPSFLNKHWPQFTRNLQKTNVHNAVKRNSIRLLQDIDIPKKYQGIIMNTCFQFLESPTEAIAVKVFSMSVLANLAKQHPGIIPELKYLMEEQQTYQTAAFKARVKLVLKQLKKLDHAKETIRS
jgi:hypothetical protein